jgi:hypothetical protein
MGVEDTVDVELSGSREDRDVVYVLEQTCLFSSPPVLVFQFSCMYFLSGHLFFSFDFCDMITDDEERHW